MDQEDMKFLAGLTLLVFWAGIVLKAGATFLDWCLR